MVESRQEKSKIEKEIKKYEVEKKIIFEELQISDIKEYMDLYKIVKRENAELNYYVQELE